MLNPPLQRHSQIKQVEGHIQNGGVGTQLGQHVMALATVMCGVIEQVQQDQALLAWAEYQWGHELESIYLARKSELDRMSLRMLRVSDAGLSMELYHRIRAEEASFEQLSWRYGEGPERLQGGLIKNQRLVDLPPAFFPLLVNLHTFEVQQPRAIGKRFVLYQLMSRQPLVFDEETRRQLLMEQLQCWEAPLVERLGAHLASQSLLATLP